MSNQVNPNEGGQSPQQESPLTVEALTAILAGEVEAQEEETEETEEETDESTESEETEESTEEEEETEEEPEATDGIDLDNLTDEQWELVRTKLKSGAAARIGKLTALNKAKDEAITALKNQQPQQAAPLEEVTSRFLEGIEDAEALQAKVAELKKLGKDTARLLLDHEDYGSNDLIDVGEKQYTKKQLRALDLEIKETLIEAVPFKQEQFRKREFIENEAVRVREKLESEVKELSDEKSPIAINFKELTESDLFKRITKQFPEAKAVLPYLTGHALRSIHGKPKQTVATATGKTPKAKPPGSPVGAAAAPAKTPLSTDPSKLRERAAQTNSRADLEAYLAERL